MKFDYWNFGNNRLAIYSEDRNLWKVAEESKLSELPTDTPALIAVFTQ
ncbi:hypothetical protein [Desulfolucanica intricata]|nr:hypothetical protein [Desulfolucanica intricata]